MKIPPRLTYLPLHYANRFHRAFYSKQHPRRDEIVEENRGRGINRDSRLLAVPLRSGWLYGLEYILDIHTRRIVE